MSTSSPLMSTTTVSSQQSLLELLSVAAEQQQQLHSATDVVCVSSGGLLPPPPPPSGFLSSGVSFHHPRDPEPNRSEAAATLNLDDLMDMVTIQCRHCGFLCCSKDDFVAHVKDKHEHELRRRKKAKQQQSEVTRRPPPVVLRSVILEKHVRGAGADPSGENAEKREELFLCGECSAPFENVEVCKRHMSQHHLGHGGHHPAPDNAGLPHSSCQRGKPKNASKSGQISLPNSSDSTDSTKAKKLRCPRKGCLYRFSESDLPLHLSCHSTNFFVESEENLDKSFRCPHCPSSLPSFGQWRRCAMHLWTEHQIDVDLLVCPVCNVYKTVIPAKLENHLLIHNEDKAFKCGTCGKSFAQMTQLRNHTVTHMNKDSDLIPLWYTKKQCDICSKFFSDSKCLKKHVQAVHSKLKPYICHVCNHQSARKAMLEMHMRQHTGEKPYKCDACEYRTGDHNSLRRHRMGHSGHKPYKCPFCDYAAIQSYAFKNHITSKHPDSDDVHICKICNFKTISRESYFGHVGEHEREREKALKLQQNAESAAAAASPSSTAKDPKKPLGRRQQQQQPFFRHPVSEDSSSSSTPMTENDSSIRQVMQQQQQQQKPRFSKKTKKVKQQRNARKSAGASGATAGKKSNSVIVEEEDSLHATMDFGGTTIPAS